tara:strand:- start:553 stop:1266 length:714 start_codon:yes stop_codon:yes gene_type:complete
MRLVQQIIYLILVTLGGLFLGILGTWWNWDNQNTDAKLKDVFFEILPDLSYIEESIPNYILVVQYVLGFLSLEYKKMFQYAGQYIFLQSILTSVRALTTSLTIMPNIHVYPYCTKEVDNFFQVLYYMMMYGTCGDYIFSGHTASAFLTYMFVHRHKKAYWWEFISGLLLGLMVTFLLLMRWHYSVDIVIACLLTWFLFRFYKRYEDPEKWFYFDAFQLTTNNKGRRKRVILSNRSGN